LIENHGDGKEDARIKGQFEEREKGLRNRKSDQILMERGFEITKQSPGEGIEKGTHEDHHPNDPEKTFSHLGQSFKNSFSIHLHPT
jgi:hypothetical protein